MAITFAKQEARPGCVTTEDAAEQTAIVDLAVDFLVRSLSAGAPNRCQGRKLKSAATRASCALAVEATSVRMGSAPDPMKIQKCKDVMAAAFAEEEATGRCVSGGDLGDIESLLDEFGSIVVEHLNKLPGESQERLQLRARAW